VELLIDRIIVTDGDVEIRYVIPLSPESEQIRFCHLRSDYFSGPDLIGPDNGQGAQQIRVFLVFRVRPRGSGPWINGLQAHFAHQPRHPFVIDLITMHFLEPHGHLAVAIERGFGVFLVNRTHDGQVEGAFASGAAIIGRAIETE